MGHDRREPPHVVLVGGGIIGTAIGYECAARGMKVTLLERQVVGGGGATRYSRGIVRGYDPDPQLMAWSLTALKFWHTWREQGLPGPSPFRACGVLILLRGDVSGRALLERYDSPHQVELLQGAALRNQFPELRLEAAGDEGWIGLWERASGYIDTRLAARLFAEGIRALGGSVLEGVCVTRIEAQQRGLKVHTSTGAVEATWAVLAAGAESLELLPTLPTRCLSIPLSCFEDVGPPIGYCLVDMESGLYVRPEPPGHFYTGGGPRQEALVPQQLPPQLDDETRRANERLAAVMLGAERTARPLHGMLGWDAYTSNLRPLLDLSSSIRGLYVATGFSGRGAKYAPVIGRRVADELSQPGADDVQHA